MQIVWGFSFVFCKAANEITITSILIKRLSLLTNVDNKLCHTKEKKKNTKFINGVVVSHADETLLKTILHIFNILIHNLWISTLSTSIRTKKKITLFLWELSAK